MILALAAAGGTDVAALGGAGTIGRKPPRQPYRPRSEAMTFRMELACCESVIENEIANGLKQKDIAETYAMALVSMA